MDPESGRGSTSDRTPMSRMSLVGESDAMHHVRTLIERVAGTDASVLLIGESGTGKELVAQALHAGSARATSELHAVNCGAIPATLIEAELFGYEKGSFTGATRSHDGIAARASGGTLFLDEITEMPMEMQPPLLRFLDTQRYFRVGGTQELTTDEQYYNTLLQKARELSATSGEGGGTNVFIATPARSPDGGHYPNR